MSQSDARARSSTRRCRGLARARALSHLLSRRAPQLRRFWAADSCSRRICFRNTALRNGTVRHIHHREFRLISIDLQLARRPIHQRGYWCRFASRYSCLKRGLADEPQLEIGLWQPARATTAKLATMGDAPRRPCRRSSLLCWPWASLS